MDSLQVKELRKYFNDVKAVDGISFDVHEGEIFGLLGPNGAGKTTTIRSIVDIFKPDSGSISVLGKPPGEAHSRIGYMPEERGLYRNHKVGEIPVYFAQLKGISVQEARRRSREWLERVDLLEWSGKKVKDLSRGMQQKLQFVVTVVHDPGLAILDEPFEGLDPVNVELVKGLIRDLRARGITVVLSSHQMNLVEALCDRILLIDHGKAVLYGELSEIKKRFSANTVLVRAAGPLPKLSSAAQVEEHDGDRQITLRGGSTPADLFRELAEKSAAVERFEVSSMPLEQIFIAVVGGKDHA
jgi:ABC-2 type transport system ATP-binding protein